MIKLIVNKQELSIVTSKVVSGTHQYLTVEGDFKGNDWTGLRKWVHFTMANFNYIVPMQNDKIEESAQLDLTEGTWEVYVHGNRTTDSEVVERITTDVQLLFVDAPHDGHPFPALTPDFEELLANQVAEANEISQGIRDDADSGRFNGATFIPDVSEEGIISWTNDHCLENPVPRNIKGPKGDTGDSGVYIGHETPTDPAKSVWIDPLGGVGFVIDKLTVTGTHAPGTTDTYYFEFSNGEDLLISIYNPINGDGTGDMVRNIYDTHQHATDIFDYADSIAADVFVATYGTTPYADIKDAYDAGKHVYVVKGSDVGQLGFINTAGANFYTFSTTGLTQFRVTSSDVWSSTSGTIIRMSDVRSEIDGTSSYPPQTKAVKTYVDSAIATAIAGITTEDEVFACSYGVTTAAQIAAARGADMFVYLEYQTRQIPLSAVVTSGGHTYYEFERTIGSTTYKYRCSDTNTWSSSTKTNITEDNVLSAISSSSDMPVSSSAIYTALAGKADAVNVDTAMSSSSTNPVQNKTIKAYVDAAVQNIGKDVKVVQVPCVANTMYDSYLLTGSLNCAVSGYTAIGVVGMQCNTPTIYLATHYVTNNVVHFGVSDCHGNGFNQGATVALTLYVLYKAN